MASEGTDGLVNLPAFVKQPRSQQLVRPMQTQVATTPSNEHNIAAYPTWCDELPSVSQVEPGPSEADLKPPGGCPFTIPCTEGGNILYDKVSPKLFVFPCQLPLEV